MDIVKRFHKKIKTLLVKQSIFVVNTYDRIVTYYVFVNFCNIFVYFLDGLRLLC